VVVIGAMRNMAGARTEELRRVLEQAARSRIQALPGVVLAEAGGQLQRDAGARHLPVLTLDGSLTVLAESRTSGSLQVRAVVEFTVRREQTLRGTVSGAATTFGSGPTLSEAARRTLQEEAVGGAVQSALQGAEQGLIVAAR
jgi:hypothetical protein